MITQVDEFIDVLIGNRRYVNCLYVYNKIDTISMEDVDRIARQPHSVVISCEMELNLDGLRKAIWEVRCVQSSWSLAHDNRWLTMLYMCACAHDCTEGTRHAAHLHEAAREGGRLDGSACRPARRYDRGCGACSVRASLRRPPSYQLTLLVLVPASATTSIAPLLPNSSTGSCTARAVGSVLPRTAWACSTRSRTKTSWLSSRTHERA